MSDLSKKWTLALTSILEELGSAQYRKMRVLLDKIPKSKKSSSSREKMPGKIIECYGLEGSISTINDVMKEIPRNDPQIQNLLRPFVDKLSEEQEKENQGKKRKRENEEEKEEQEEKQEEKQEEEEVKQEEEEQEEKQQEEEQQEEEEAEEQEEVLTQPVLDQQTSCQPDKEPNTERKSQWKKTVSDVKSSGLLETEGITVKVVQKSGLRPYRTQSKVKGFFYVAAADETGSIKLMIYGGDHYKDIKEDKSYLIHSNLIKDAYGVKVTTRSKVSETKSVDVPEELEMEAQKLIYSESPFYSVQDIKSSDDKTAVSVEGKVTTIDPVKKVKVHYRRQKIKKQDFHLTDDTGNICISMWDEGATQQCKGLSVEDVIKVSNLKVHRYHETTSLNSTRATTIHKNQSVGVRTVTVEIIGVLKATKKETQLEVEVDQHMHTFIVTSRLLAKAFGFKLEGDLKASLLDKMPLTAEAETQGNRIKKITAAEKK